MNGAQQGPFWAPVGCSVLVPKQKIIMTTKIKFSNVTDAWWFCGCHERWEATNASMELFCQEAAVMCKILITSPFLSFFSLLSYKCFKHCRCVPCGIDFIFMLANNHWTRYQSYNSHRFSVQVLLFVMLCDCFWFVS